MAIRSSTVPEFVVPAVATTQNGFLPRRTIVSYRLLQLLRIELRSLVHRDPAQGLASDSQQPGRLVERMMRFRRSIEHGLAADRSHAFFNRVGKLRTPAPEPAR